MNTLEPADPLDEDGAVSQRAAGFFERRRFGEWSETDQTELEAWLAESTSHYVAFLRVEAIAARADQLAAIDAQESLTAAQESGGRAGYRGFVLPILTAASVTLVVALAVPFVNSWLQPPDRFFSTDVGGSTVVKFGDGTEIDLNTDTSLRARMTTVERVIWLEKGEAWFHVVHDAANPFTVIVGKHRVSDLGTEFAIHRSGNDVEVKLASGRAVLSTEGTATTLLAPGDDAIATPVSLSVTRKTPQELSDAFAWRRGVLVFRKTKFADVIAAFNRYNETKLVLSDPSIADVAITANLKADRYDDFLQLAQTMLKLRVSHQGNDILISSDQGKDTKRPVRRKL